MAELKNNDTVNLVGGGKATIVKELGRGGQGIVYSVTVNGEKKALKWYANSPDDNLYRNLELNIQSGAPDPSFLWPESITEKQNGSYGYIMKLRPQNYHEFSRFLINKVSFKSFDAMLKAAMQICNGFKKLHLNGYSYQDLNDGNFFIDPATGDVLICDNDNVVAQGQKSGIMGKARYMAPEVVAGGTPDKYSDRFSLAVLLFLLFYCNHPFEGVKVAGCPCLTEDFEKKFYGSEILFIYDVNDHSNLPVRGIHNNVIRRWPALPPRLREAFTKEFSQEVIKNPSKRMMESEWQKVIAAVRDSLVKCPYCGEETFVNIVGAKDNCLECQKEIDLAARLVIGNRQIPLVKNTHLYIDSDNTPEALVTTDANGTLVVKNETNDAWAAETPSGKTKTVVPGDIFPVRAGIKVNFKDNKAEVKVL